MQGECVTCGEDDTKCSPFGLDAWKYPTRLRTHVKLFMVTGHQAPFCRYHYAVELDLAKPPEAEKYVYGQVKLTLSGLQGFIVNASLHQQSKRALQLTHGEKKQFLHVNELEFERVEKVQLHWDYVSDPLYFWTICWSRFSCNKQLYVERAQISVMNNYPEKKRIENTFKSCPMGNDLFCTVLSSDHCNLSLGTACENEHADSHRLSFRNEEL